MKKTASKKKKKIKKRCVMHGGKLGCTCGMCEMRAGCCRG